MRSCRIEMKIGILQCKNICYNSLNYFLSCIEKTLNKLGIDTVQITEFDETALRGRYDALICMNSQLISVRLENGSFLLDFFQCPVFDILVDSPYCHHTSLEGHMKNLHVILLDEGHVEYCKKYYNPFQSVKMGFLLGPMGKIRKYEERQFDVLFSGTVYNRLELTERVLPVLDVTWKKDLFSQMIENGIKNPQQTTYEYVCSWIEKKKIPEADIKQIMSTLGTYAEFYLRGYYREKIVSLLIASGIHLCVVGNGWKQLFAECPDNLLIKGTIDFAETAEITGNSKIALNIMPWFKDGIHDRVLTAMWNGAVCVTDSSSYIQRNFADGHNIVLYDLNHLEELPIKLRWLLEHPCEAKGIADRGNRKVKQEFSWERFVIKNILEKVVKM